MEQKLNKIVDIISSLLAFAVTACGLYWLLFSDYFEYLEIRKLTTLAQEKYVNASFAYDEEVKIDDRLLTRKYMQKDGKGIYNSTETNDNVYYEYLDYSNKTGSRYTQIRKDDLNYVITDEFEISDNNMYIKTQYLPLNFIQYIQLRTSLQYGIKQTDKYYVERCANVKNYINKETGLVEKVEVEKVGVESENYLETYTYNFNFDEEVKKEDILDNFKDISMYNEDEMYDLVSDLERVIKTDVTFEELNLEENKVFILMSKYLDKTELQDLIINIDSSKLKLGDEGFKEGIISTENINRFIDMYIGLIKRQDVDLKDRVMLNETLHRIDLNSIDDDTLLNKII